MPRKKREVNPVQTLEEVLNELPENTVVAVGSAVSYMYISTLDKEKIYAEIDAYKSKYQKSLETAISQLKYMKEQYSLLPDKLNQLYEDLDELREKVKRKEHQIEVTKKNIEEYPNKIANTFPKRIETLEKEINSFISAKERKVLRTYPQNCVDYALCIIIEGNEHGNYVLRSEYESGVCDE